MLADGKDVFSAVICEISGKDIDNVVPAGMGEISGKSMHNIVLVIQKQIHYLSCYHTKNRINAKPDPDPIFPLVL